MNLSVIIIAGGRGERLWPLSTSETPKQFMKLGEKSLFQSTVVRAARLVSPEHIYVVAPEAYRELVQTQSELPHEHILIEPAQRSTAACIGLAAALLQRKIPDGPMIILPADHVIRKEEHFIELVKIALEIATGGDRLVTLGITPDHPATGYGYVQFDLEQALSHRAYKVLSFTEKPDRTKAEAFLKSGNYLWNSGMFIWRADTILKALEQYMPELFHVLKMDFHGPEFHRRYERLPAISIDYGVMEKAENVWVIPAEIEWSDVGDWAAFERIYGRDAQGNVVLADHCGADTQRCILFSESRRIATLGVEDLVVVDTLETLLVMHKSRAQEVRELARHVEESTRSLLEASECVGRDPDGMLERLMSFPQQCAEALQLGRQCGFSLPAPPDEIVVLGMGGSGIVGELLQRFLALPVYVQHGETMPQFVDRKTLIIAVSYSGNTLETLTALKRALPTGVPALCVTSGGRLKELALQHKLPLIIIPSGSPPRAALGYLLFSTLSALARAGLVRNSSNWEQVLSVLQELALQTGPQQPTGSNPAKQLALRLHQKVPIIYGVSRLTDVAAQRWKTQFNENSKQPAFWNALPELSHNEIEAFGHQSNFLPNAIVILLRSTLESELDQQRFDAVKALLIKHRLEFAEAWSHGQDPLAQMLSLIYLGDLVSVYLAILNGVNPRPVPSIESFKKRVSAGGSDA